ncbi:hypothetical protein PSTT_12671 [Puccinia striiformis]|uniref:Uncharacterized protein n=1 Tax=Puccinia striiformis TaxID=27350 RepID=A0A2S4UV89_9BASI|nr:hypothetical protein PSTT_12671 [Puccinia striiformis]
MDPMPEGSINISPSKPLKTQSLPQSDLDKVKHICKELTRLKISPKESIMGLLTKSDSDLRYRYCTWATYYGWSSTIELVEAIGSKFGRSQKSADRWAQFILAKLSSPQRALQMCVSSLLRHCLTLDFRLSTFFPSPITTKWIIPFWCLAKCMYRAARFFSEEAKQERVTRLTTTDPPFLYKFLLGTMDSDFLAKDLSPTNDKLDTSLALDGTTPPTTADKAKTRLLATPPGTNLDSLPPYSESGRLAGATPALRKQVPVSLDASMADYEGFAYTFGIDLIEGKQACYHQISTVVCSMVTFPEIIDITGCSSQMPYNLMHVGSLRQSTNTSTT